jgi:hypothetical protein
MSTNKVHLQLDDDWQVMRMSNESGTYLIYWLSHEHPERGDFRHTDLVRREGELKCYYCGEIPPQEALGFVNMLEGYMLYEGGKK